MATNTFASRLYAGVASFFSVVAVMLSAAIIAKRLRWSSVSKRLISTE